MTSIERTAYPRFKESLTHREMDLFYTPNEAELELVRTQARGDPQRLMMLVLLKTFQNLGYFPALGEVPDFIVAHLRVALDLPAHVRSAGGTSSALYRYYQIIREYQGATAYTEGGDAVAEAAIIHAAQTMHDPAELISAGIEELVRQRFELPAYSRIDRMAGRIRAQINETWYREVYSRLTSEERTQLSDLLHVQPGRTFTEFALIKQPTGKAVLSQMRLTVERLRYLESMLDTYRLLQGIPYSRIKGFADEADKLDAGDLDRYLPAHKLTLILCLIHRIKISLRDDLATMLIKRMRLVHKQAKEELAAIREVQQEMTDSLIDLLSRIARRAGDDLENTIYGELVRRMMEAEGGSQAVVERCESISLYKGNNILPLLWGYFRHHRSALFELVERLDIQATTQDRMVVEALRFIKEHRDSRAQYVPAEISLDFASDRWQRLIVTRREGAVWLDRRQLEVCVFSHVAAELQAGDLYVVHSDLYADTREQLLSWEECEPQLEEYCAEIGLPATPQAFRAQLQAWLTAVAEQVDLIFPNDGQISFKNGRPSLKRIRRAPTPDGAKALEDALGERMPPVTLLDILGYVERLVGFTRHFGPLSGSDPKLADPAIRYLMTIFAYGCNLGPRQTARHSKGSVTANDLSRANLRHITADKLDAAIRDVIDYFARFDLPRYWGTGRSASADGTLIDIYQNNLLSAFHVRYGAYGGIAYHHVADTYVALFSHFISVGIWEAVYIIDGLLKNTSEIQPEMLHGDTQAQSLPVFGFAYLLGIQLMPRIRNWQDLTLYRPSADAHYENIDELFSDVIDWDLIETHWQDMMQVILSIRAGRIMPSMLLRKLGNESRKNKLYRAFRELGRVVRTVFLLQYITDETMRRQITAATNKSESYNEFTGWVTFGGDTIPTNDPIEQEKRIKYTQLIANCIILKNVIDMSKLLPQLGRDGYQVSPATIGVMSPYLTEHIRRFGDYVLRLQDIVLDPVDFALPDFNS